jgi:PRTRC genetic system protein C
MATIKTAQRIFKMGSVELPDPDPSLSPKKVVELYSTNYPQLKSATVSEPELIGDRLVYIIELPPVKTKG